MLPALADTQPLCLRVLVLLRHRSRAVRFSFLRKNLVHHGQKILHIRVNRHVHMQGRLFQLFGIDIIHNHIRLARPGSKTVTDLTETQTASERQHQIAVLDREVARAIADVAAFSDVQRVFVIDTVDAVRAGHNRDSQLFNHAHENIVRRADTDTISGIDHRTFGGADFLDDRTRRLLRHTCRKFCTKFTFSGGIHWRDAKKLRDAGLRVIRNAHYPQDPAFMDACDELGLFVIVNTPGWQFWNDDPIFGQRVYDDIRNMVRRDRNHASVWLWEPILNETWYPEDFARNVADILKEEYPYPYCYAGCDATARGKEYFPVHFTHPAIGGGGAFNAENLNPQISYFTREWGDNVDNWNSHNSPSRASRAWGEYPMLVQAQGYAKPDYRYTCYDILYRTSRQHMGGCLWHSFDHQRGYHPDPFYGGIMDAFRQPKLSYYMFCAQRPTEVNGDLIADSGPMVYIANYMTPFSPKDVTVYSNCDEVRLTCCKGGKPYVYRKSEVV